MKEKIIKIIKFIIVVLLFIFGDFFAYIPIFLLKINTNTLTANQRLCLSIFSSFLVMIILIFLYFKEIKEELKLFKKNKSEFFDIGFKCWVVGLVIMALSNIIINYIGNGAMASNEESVQAMLKASPYLVAISTIIIAPISEELIFRKAFRTIIKNKYIYVLVSGLIFGGLHVFTQDNLDLIQCLYLIPYSSLGIAFAYSYSKTDSIFTTILMHSIHNAILTTLSILSMGMII